MTSGIPYSQKGKFLDIVIEGNSKFVLCAIDKFFVEVEWNIEKEKIVGKGEFNYSATSHFYYVSFFNNILIKLYSDPLVVKNRPLANDKIFSENSL